MTNLFGNLAFFCCMFLWEEIANTWVVKSGLKTDETGGGLSFTVRMFR